MLNPFLTVSATPSMQRSQTLIPDTASANSADGASGPSRFAQALAQRQQVSPPPPTPYGITSPLPKPQARPQPASAPAPTRATVHAPDARATHSPARATAEARPQARPAPGHPSKSALTPAPADTASSPSAATETGQAAKRLSDPPIDANPQAMGAWLSQWAPEALPTDAAPIAPIATTPATDPLGPNPLPATITSSTSAAALVITNPFGTPDVLPQSGLSTPAPSPGADLPSGMVMTMFGLRPAPTAGAPITNPFIDAMAPGAEPGASVPADSAPVSTPVIKDSDLLPGAGARPADPATSSAQSGVIDPATAAALLAGQAPVTPLPLPNPSGTPLDAEVDANSSERRFMTTVPRGSLPMRSPFGEPGTDLAVNERGLPPGGLPDPSLARPALDAPLVGNPFGDERAAMAINETSHNGQSFGQMLELATQNGVHAAGRSSGLASSTPTVEVNLPTPVQSPEFPEALGVQVSLLARDGVQHAELHLNPSEMGPISVRIALEGTQAQIDFGADSATTRALIEAGLPELASALRESGLTLSGGGVGQHPRDNLGSGAGEATSGNRQDASNGGGNRQHSGGNGPHRGDADIPAPASQVRRLRVANGVDLYA